MPPLPYQLLPFWITRELTLNAKQLPCTITQGEKQTLQVDGAEC